MLEINISSHYAFEGERKYRLVQTTDEGYTLDYERLDYHQPHQAKHIRLKNEDIEPLLKTLFDQKLPLRKSTLFGLDGVMNEVSINRTGNARSYHWWGEGDESYQGLNCFVNAVKQLFINRLAAYEQNVKGQIYQ